MGRGEGHSESQPSRARRRIGNRFRVIEENHRLLKKSIGRYPSAESFIKDWLSDEFEAQEHMGAMVAFYDRIVTSMNQIVDMTEKALRARGEIEDPHPDGKNGPGRWRRLAVYGVLDEELVERCKQLMETRNILLKEYRELGADDVADVYEDVKAFLRLAPNVVPQMRDWVEVVAP